MLPPSIKAQRGSHAALRFRSKDNNVEFPPFPLPPITGPRAFAPAMLEPLLSLDRIKCCELGCSRRGARPADLDSAPFLSGLVLDARSTKIRLGIRQCASSPSPYLAIAQASSRGCGMNWQVELAAPPWLNARDNTVMVYNTCHFRPQAGRAAMGCPLKLRYANMNTPGMMTRPPSGSRPRAVMAVSISTSL